MKALSVTFGLILSMCVFSAVAADSQFYWNCLVGTDCKNVRLEVKYSPPVDVNLTCQGRSGEYLPKSIDVKSENLYVACNHPPAVNGDHRYKLCTYAGTVDPKIHHFDVSVTVVC